jgi:hypothetical protein
MCAKLVLICALCYVCVACADARSACQRLRLIVRRELLIATPYQGINSYTFTQHVHARRRASLADLAVAARQ